MQKKIRCSKCNFFDVKENCSHCEKCEKFELEQFAIDANNQLLKVLKFIPQELN